MHDALGRAAQGAVAARFPPGEPSMAHHPQAQVCHDSVCLIKTLPGGGPQTDCPPAEVVQHDVGQLSASTTLIWFSGVLLAAWSCALVSCVSMLSLYFPAVPAHEILLPHRAQARPESWICFTQTCPQQSRACRSRWGLPAGRRSWSGPLSGWRPRQRCPPPKLLAAWQLPSCCRSCGLCRWPCRAPVACLVADSCTALVVSGSLLGRPARLGPGLSVGPVCWGSAACSWSVLGSLAWIHSHAPMAPCRSWPAELPRCSAAGPDLPHRLGAV